MSILLDIDIPGIPVGAPKSSDKHIWSGICQKRIHFIQTIINHQDTREKKIDSSINLEIAFYFKHSSFKKGAPSIISLMDFACYALEGRVYKRKCRIIKANAEIKFNEDEHTNIKIMESDENY